ncbi:MAG TPA: helix-turn-helix domain-containing protein [Terracidiphilus sp.]|nr:helix-turn-helix domain-containing protein [Terracidiphilus sp.]
MTRTATYAQWFLEPYCIGTKLRSLRLQKRLTLSRLAAETGLSTALLSKLETDRMVPTLPTLATISRVYGVGMSHFFSEPREHSLSITRQAHLQGNGRGLESTKVTPLHTVGAGDRLVAQVIELAAGSNGAAGESSAETGGLLYVLEGCLQIAAGGLTEELDAGDCAYMRSGMAVNLSAGGKHRCRLLSVTSAA